MHYTPDDRIRHWRWCADADELVIGVAAARGVNPLLVELMRADVVQMRRWADGIEDWIKRAAAAGDPRCDPALIARARAPEPGSSRFARLLTAFKALC